MQEDRLKQYDLEALRRQIPEDRAELFLGFVPWAADAQGWQRSVKQSMSETPERPVVRTVWDDPEDRDRRVLIDVVECMSAAEALDALTDRLAWNQLARLDEGPTGLGFAAFEHPAGAPPAIYFARGNLCIAISSYGRQPVDTAPWSERLNRRLDDRPSVDRALITLRAERARVKVGQAVNLSYELPWEYGEDGYLKFLLEGGTLVRREDRLILTGTKPGELKVEAYLLEPGRETHAGRLSVTVE